MKFLTAISIFLVDHRKAIGLALLAAVLVLLSADFLRSGTDAPVVVQSSMYSAPVVIDPAPAVVEPPVMSEEKLVVPAVVAPCVAKVHKAHKHHVHRRHHTTHKHHVHKHVAHKIVNQECK